jgi:NADH:ubiquinone oxidoreductase subunit K
MLFDISLISIIVLCIGIIGFAINRDSLIALLVNTEILVLASFINLIGSASMMSDVGGHVILIIVLCTISAEAAIGLALFIAYFKLSNNIDPKRINILGG